MADLALAFAVKGPWSPGSRLLDLAIAALADPRIELHLACDQLPSPDLPPGVAVHVSGRASLFRLWGLAIARSSAPHVAILHAQAPPARGWTDAVLAALDAGDALCGPVEPACSAADPRITGYLVEYCQFHRPRRPRMAEVPGNNLILPRAILGSSERLEREGFSKTRMLVEGRIAPRWVDAALVHHERPFALPAFCARRFRHARSYGAQRLMAPGAPHRLIAVAITGVLPIVRVARIAAHAWHHRSLRGALVRRLPAILLAETCWSVGELVGYVTSRAGDLSRLD